MAEHDLKCRPGRIPSFSGKRKRIGRIKNTETQRHRDTKKTPQQKTSMGRFLCVSVLISALHLADSCAAFPGSRSSRDVSTSPSRRDVRDATCPSERKRCRLDRLERSAKNQSCIRSGLPG